MIKNAEQYPIRTILDNESDIRFIIPKYQREYVWGKQQWEKIIDNISENERGYFLGSIICVDRETDSFKGKRLEIIDGQQRLTTISLLYAAIYSKLSNIEEKDEELVNDITNLKYRLIQKDDKNSKLRLSSQNENYHDYLTILSDLGITEFEKKEKYVGLRLISKTFNYFKKYLETIPQNELRSLLKKINDSILVKIEVSTMSDAFILFESLNNTGVPLSAIELIKNKMLSQLEKERVMNIDQAYIKWKRIVDDHLKDVKVQERFLRHYYNAFKFDKKVNIKGAPKATKSNLIKIYEELIQKDPKWMLEQFQEKAKIYNSLIEPEKGKLNNELYDSLIDLSNVGASPAYQFLLYLFSNHQKKESMQLKVIKFLVTYFVRRNLTDFPPTRDLDKIFIDLIELCEEESCNFSTIYNYLTNKEEDRIGSLENFKKYLSGNIYDENVGMTRFILAKIEEVNTKTKEIYTDFWARNEKNKFDWTIEHIFPQGDRIPICWIKMIAEGDEDKAQEYRQKYVHKIGNLTLTGYNPNLSNHKFLEKRDLKNKEGKHIGFKNGLYLNKEIKNKSAWKIKDIEKRTEKMVQEALKIFKI